MDDRTLKTIDQLIKANRIQLALERLSALKLAADHEKKLILISGEWHHFQERKQLGLITPPVEDDTEARFRERLYDFVHMVDRDEKGLALFPIRSPGSANWLRILGLGLAALAMAGMVWAAQNWLLPQFSPSPHPDEELYKLTETLPLEVFHLQGLVLDAKTHMPLPAAEVHLGDSVALTNQQGLFGFQSKRPFPPTPRLMISKPGYTTLDSSLLDAQDSLYVFGLSPSALAETLPPKHSPTPPPSTESSSRQKVPEPKPNSSYYIYIDGQIFDRMILEEAIRRTDGPGDGRVSKADAKVLLSLFADDQQVTEVEERSLDYIQEKHNWTEAAKKWFKGEFDGLARSKQ